MRRPGVNRRQLKRTISRGLGSKFKKDITRQVKASVERAKNLMLAEFESHVVTKEIEGGPSASNLSGTLGGVGNLFSFIGFDSSDRPIAPVRRVLMASTRLQSVTKLTGDQLAFEITITVPSKEDLRMASPLPWAAARSWVIGIEQGLSGLGSFLVKPGGGRSGAAIQVTGVMRSGGFKNTKYISLILSHLHSNLLKFIKS